MKDNKLGVLKTTGAMNMNEINEEIILTINLMQTVSDECAYSAMQDHLKCLLEIKRSEYKKRLVERSWADSPAPYKSVKLDLQFGDPDKPLTADQWMAGLAMVKDDDDGVKPLTADELLAGGWLCTDVSKECANAFKAKHLRVFNSDEWGDDGLWVGCVMDACGDVKRKGIFFDFAGLKQIKRTCNEFYWSE